MMNGDRLERLQQRLTPRIQEAVSLAIKEGRLPSAMQAAADSTAAKAIIGAGRRTSVEMAGGRVPIAAMEAIVQFVGRPPLVVRNDRVILEPLEDFPDGTAELIRRIEGCVKSVGRVEFINAAQAWGGTGWIVEKPTPTSALVVTNRHVAQSVARTRADGRAVFLRGQSGAAMGARIDFSEDADELSGDMLTVPVVSVEYLADDNAADIALLRVRSEAFELPEPLVLTDTTVRAGDLVAIVGYPAYDHRNSSDDQDYYFRGLYDVKRFAPGRILQAATAGAQLTHDCTSLGGNSGSPLMRLEDARVVGLHFSGLYGKYNAAIEARTVMAILSGHRPVAVRLPRAPEEAADGHHSLQDLQGREGFNPEFLPERQRTPWPALPEHRVIDLAVPSDAPDEPNEIRYTHFGVKYSSSLRLPIMTAVNIDGAQSVRIKRGRDKWFSDPRVPLGIQLTASNFADHSIDRGHMVRREDPNWSPKDDPSAATRADLDTFHYVNAAAQHKELNRGKSLWLGLESYILESARTHGFRACVFTGPILRTESDLDDEWILDGAVIAREFWKMVVAVDVETSRLHATAYILSQGQMIRSLHDRRSRRESLEGFVLGEYRTFQVRIADLAEATGYNFSHYISADPLEAVGEAIEAVETGEPVVLPLERFSDIRL